MSKIASVGPLTNGVNTNHPLLVVGAMLLAAFTVGFDTRVFLVGLADLRGMFGLSFDQGAWLASFASAPQILIAPAVAWLVTVFGIRRIMVIPCFVYAVISLLIPFVHGLGPLIVLHVMRALLLGTFIPATIMITFRNLEPRYWLIGLAIYSLRLPLSQSVGVFLVGVYTEYFGLQWLYWQDVFIAPLIGLLIFLGAPREPIDHTLLARADWGGMLLLGASMGLIYIGLDQGKRLNWFQSGTVTALIAAGLLLAVGFFINESLVRYPWAHISVLLSRNVALGYGAIVAFILASITSSSLVPGYLETVVGLRPIQIGTFYIPVAILPLFLFAALATLTLRFFDVRVGLMIGFTALAVSSFMAIRITGLWALQNFPIIMMLQMLGQAFALLSAIVMIVANSDPKRSTANSAYIQVVRLGSAELAVSLINTLVNKREQFHSNVIGSYVTQSAPPTQDVLSKLAETFHPFSLMADAAATATLSGLVRAQATILAYSDCFLISFWAGVAGLVLVALMVSTPQGPLSPSGHPVAKAVPQPN
ncbi:MFS transporter [Rhizobium sp. BK251]|uniref:MFS transporter n=1 Tax=Rhizobium sp. BK251 TaxID=2512125 RepID=UPI001042BC40|nr:MFS transporter [Rhizobium sp. BK251]TCL75940.1 DHA2 family multidrug resistance protein [Rhizobium sp. BK251]